MYVLYHFPYSQHSRRVVSLLEQCGIPYVLNDVAMDKGEHMSFEFLNINPNHQVPALKDGHFTIYESNAILRYICNKHHLSQWYPDDYKIRGIVDQWLDWNQCRLSPSVVDIVLNQVFLAPNGDNEAVRRGEAKLAELLPILDVALEKNAFLAASSPTIADLSVASNIFQLGLAGKAVSGNIEGWYAKILDLQGFQKSLPR